MKAAFKYLLFYDCNNMFTAGFTVQYVSPYRYVQKMSKEVEGEDAGQRLNGSCEPRKKKKKKTTNRTLGESLTKYLIMAHCHVIFVFI